MDMLGVTLILFLLALVVWMAVRKGILYAAVVVGVVYDRNAALFDNMAFEGEA